MKFLLDMNLSPRWIDLLRQAGFESAHWSTVGPMDAPDSQVMDFARTNDYVVLTHDLDFGAILAASHATKPSVVQVRANDVRPETIGDKVVVALRAQSAHLQRGALVTIDINRTRVRILPLSEIG